MAVGHSAFTMPKETRVPGARGRDRRGGNVVNFDFVDGSFFRGLCFFRLYRYSFWIGSSAVLPQKEGGLHRRCAMVGKHSSCGAGYLFHDPACDVFRSG